MANSSTNGAVPKKYNFCTSQLKTTTEKFVWTIENFSKRQQKTGESLESSNFILTAPNGNLLKWRISIYPNGFDEDCKDYVALYLKLVDSKTAEIEAKFSFAIHFSDIGEDLNIPSKKDEITKFNIFGDEWGYKRLLKRETLVNEEMKLMASDRLTIVCELTVQQEWVKKAPLPNIDVPECQALEDMGQLFEESLFTDCRIIAGNSKVFKAHKGILACRSRVFAAMFKHGMTEAKNDVVKIDDVQSDVLEQMLKFIYSGTAPKLAEMAEELLEAADKYQLNRLKVLCERELVDSLRNVNACRLLVMANLHSSDHLKAEAINFIKVHATEVMETEGWQFLKANFGELIDEIMKAMAGRK